MLPVVMYVSDKWNTGTEGHSYSLHCIADQYTACLKNIQVNYLINDMNKIHPHDMI